jgi:tetratricopeptide (TPR) repeat protein
MSDTANERYMKGMTLFGEGDHPAAEEAYRQALKVQPKWTEAMHGLAMTLMHQGRLEDAITVGKEITEIDGEDPFAHTSLSIFYQRQSAIAEEKGDKQAALDLIAEAEKSGAQARLLSWKQELRTNPDAPKPDLPEGMDVIQ